MKKALLAAIALLFAVQAFGQEQQDNNLITSGQVLIRVKQHFLKESVPWNGSLYAHATFFSSFDKESGYFPILFTYIGPRVNLGRDIDFYLLGGTRNDTAGMSATASAWLNIPFNKKKSAYKDNFFAEADWYIPIDGHLPRLYTQLEFTHSLEKDLSIGIHSETLATTEDWEYHSMAVGPVIYVGRLGLWFSYDSLPSNKDADSVFVRAMFTL